jgi:guanylate kinase
MTENRKPLVYIVSAPSGSGKSTLTNELLKLVPNLVFSISYTTRDARGSEQNGKQYHFISTQEFDRMVREKDFLEHANVHGNCYGTARQFLRDAGK